MTPRWKLPAGLALTAVALCLGAAAVLAPAQAADDRAADGRAADHKVAVDEVDEAEAQWRVTEHPGANLPTDPESVGSREIYPGQTLDQLGYTGVEAEWAVYQKPLGDATSVIEEDFPDEYAFAYFGPNRTFTVGFAGDAPAGAVALLDGTGLPYSTVEAVGFTDADSQATVTRVSGEVMALLGDADLLSDGSAPGAGFSVWADHPTAPGAIVVEITGDDTDIRTVAMAAVATVSVGAPFTMTIVEGGGNMVLG